MWKRALPLLLVSASALLAQERTLTLPRGTKAQKMRPGVHVLTFPDGQRLEVKGLDLRAGIIGDCGLQDRTGKLLAVGQKGRLTPAVKPSGKGPEDPTSFVKIDDDIVWLPATLRFDAKAMPPDPLGKAPLKSLKPGEIRGLNPQPEPPARPPKG